MPKYDFNKVAYSKFTGEHSCRSNSTLLQSLLQTLHAKQRFEIALRHECSPANLLQISRTLFPNNTSGGVSGALSFMFYSY